MLLVVNCFLEDRFAESFDNAIIRSIGKEYVERRFVRMSEIHNMHDLSPYTHMIISGSEASTLDDYPWNKHLERLVHSFVQSKKAVLGICYGHQFLVRALAGKEHVRRAANPEMGWTRVDLCENTLFNQINRPVCMVAHYDEVFDLPESFKIIASTPRCGVHGFQYKDLPVWGVQFHPEYDKADGDEIFDVFSKKDPGLYKYFINDLDDENSADHNKKFFSNFLRVQV
ncbi:MAG: hypothetical protein HPY66_2735 [Firmicutes bacterium]|nr:hypothetical protein [Bacillota bacterium]MDI6706106.1 gamma-glutamyl-gamma-aminobutyrate hydrolase family protein [Bacillota bacterium]